MSVQSEVILAQEQGAMMRSGGAEQELEAEFMTGEREGTLVLTNSRVIFVCTNVKADDLPSTGSIEDVLAGDVETAARMKGNHGPKVRVLYSDVEDLDNIPKGAPNVFVPIESISAVKGHKGGIGRPSLTVEWGEGGKGRSAVFTEVLTGRRERNLNDWAQVILDLKDGKIKAMVLPEAPSIDTLEGKVAHVLADMQEKGVMEVEDDVETEFKVDLDPDEVQAACDKLVQQKLLLRHPDPSGDVFYRRVSPLGEDDLSS